MIEWLKNVKPADKCCHQARKGFRIRGLCFDPPWFSFWAFRTMKLYWSQKDIPALKGLTYKQREAAKRAVIFKVWKHWQVWLPFAIVFAVFISALKFIPPIPYRAIVVLVP